MVKNKKEEKEMGIMEALGSILPGLGDAFIEWCQQLNNIGKTETEEEDVDENGYTHCEVVEPDQIPEKTGLMSKEKINLKKMTKKQIKQLMDKIGVKYNSGDTKADLIQKLEWSNE